MRNYMLPVRSGVQVVKRTTAKVLVPLPVVIENEPVVIEETNDTAPKTITLTFNDGVGLTESFA